MVNKELFIIDSVPRYLKVLTPDNELFNEVWEESLELEESICSESTLKFGCCEASIFKLRIINTVMPLAGKKITPRFLCGEGNEMQLGEYKVNSDQPTADRRYRDIVAYDAMYDIVNADVTEWYNIILPDEDSTVTLREFRDSFLAHFGIEQEAVELPNDSMLIKRSYEPSGELSGSKVITAICEINACFGHIGRDGKFQYIFLKERTPALYPDMALYPLDSLYPHNGDTIQIFRSSTELVNELVPDDELYPGDSLCPNQSEDGILKSYYISMEYEDYKSNRINKLAIKDDEGNITLTVGDGDNCYIVEENFLVFGKEAAELEEIANNIFPLMQIPEYVPFTAEAKGTPCLEVGDAITIYSSEKAVETYILQRTLKGIQALRDSYSAEGKEYRETDNNSYRKQITQLRQKTTAIKNYVLNVEGKVEINAKAIEANAEKINLKASRNELISEINLCPEQITISAKKIDLVGIVNADVFISALIKTDKLKAMSAEIVQGQFEDMLGEDLQISGYLGILRGMAYQNIAVEWREINGVKYLVGVE